MALTDMMGAKLLGLLHIYCEEVVQIISKYVFPSQIHPVSFTSTMARICEKSAICIPYERPQEDHLSRCIPLQTSAQACSNEQSKTAIILRSQHSLEAQRTDANVQVRRADLPFTANGRSLLICSFPEATALSLMFAQRYMQICGRSSGDASRQG